MTNIIAKLDNCDPRDDDLPSYKDPGRILFHYLDDDKIFGAEIIDYDADKATFWLHDGGFMDCVVRDMINLEMEGHYVLEGVLGYSWKDYWGEYYEEWEFQYCRRASDEEIADQALCDVIV